MPKRRRSVVHELEVRNDRGRAKTYIIAGVYEDGSLGEIKLDQGKTGSEFRTALHAFSLVASLALQHGVTPAAIAGALADIRDATGGKLTTEGGHDECSSIWDAISQVLRREYA